MRELWTIVVLGGGTLVTMLLPAGLCLWMLVVALRSGSPAAIGLHGVLAAFEVSALVFAFTTTRGSWWPVALPGVVAALQVAARCGLHIPGR